MTLYSIKDLEYLSGIKAHTIRIWEKRYRLLDPDRTDTNIRSYSDNDVRKILNVAMLVKSGYKISTVATFDEGRLQNEILRINQLSVDPEKIIDQFLCQTVNLDPIGFEKLLERIIDENGFSKTIQEIIFPFFERIGILWQTGSIFTSHEHFVSNLIRNKLIVESAKFEKFASAKSVLFFLHENEMHELGLLYANYLAARSVMHCIYLGQNVPFGDLANLLINTKFDVVCTSFIQAIGKSEMEQYLANLSMVFNQNRIVIAGRQIAINKPKLPSNVLVVKNDKDFIRRISE